MQKRRIAVVLFNLGGPDSLEAVRPFLRNLFNDRAIIGAPQPFRGLIAELISRTRAKAAKANYALMGGRSPLLPETIAQAETLEAALAERPLPAPAKCFIAMRYWRPFVQEAAAAAAAYGATEAILAPLYPQFSTTTTASAFLEWRKHSALPATALCCYPSQERFAAAHAEVILEAWRAAGEPARPRVLFSAHGLPKAIVARGDPYQWQIERSAAAVAALLPPDWETRVCYQSRVGPLEWLAPSTLEEIAAAERDRQGVIVAPIAFVSEHVETLVELDIEYAAHARALPFYARAPALSVQPHYIAALADLVAAAAQAPGGWRSETGGRICPASFALCPNPAHSAQCAS